MGGACLLSDSSPTIVGGAPRLATPTEHCTTQLSGGQVLNMEALGGVAGVVCNSRFAYVSATALGPRMSQLKAAAFKTLS